MNNSVNEKTMYFVVIYFTFHRNNVFKFFVLLQSRLAQWLIKVLFLFLALWNHIFYVLCFHGTSLLFCEYQMRLGFYLQFLELENIGFELIQGRMHSGPYELPEFSPSLLRSFKNSFILNKNVSRMRRKLWIQEHNYLMAYHVYCRKCNIKIIHVFFIVSINNNFFAALF